MRIKTTEFIIISLILFSFIIGIYLYPLMPERMVSHWNIKGEADDYLSKFWGVFLIPLISIGLFLLYLIIPQIDPLKENIKKFRKYFDGFFILLFLFLFYVYLLTIFWNFGLKFNIGQAMMPALAILFYYCGVLLEKAKRNWFIGIKTPWTLSSDKVWDKTHQLGGRLFKITGLIVLLGAFFKEYILWFVLVPIIITAIYTIAYSYFEYQKVGKSKKFREIQNKNNG
ncbi:SdpI family protein [bacterium]|nr:SdpI family protein [bacterium]